ncbi:hypothetical protein HK101_002195 [Irineochytrium annulatum]|nr:hypothetical protein HK101_002195 [Irineochytrium annulatum]
MKLITYKRRPAQKTGGGGEGRSLSADPRPDAVDDFAFVESDTEQPPKPDRTASRSAAAVEEPARSKRSTSRSVAADRVPPTLKRASTDPTDSPRKKMTLKAEEKPPRPERDAEERPKLKRAASLSAVDDEPPRKRVAARSVITAPAMASGAGSTSANGMQPLAPVIPSTTPRRHISFQSDCDMSPSPPSYRNGTRDAAPSPAPPLNRASLFDSLFADGPKPTESPSTKRKRVSCMRAMASPDRGIDGATATSKNARALSEEVLVVDVKQSTIVSHSKAVEATDGAVAEQPKTTRGEQLPFTYGRSRSFLTAEVEVENADSYAAVTKRNKHEGLDDGSDEEERKEAKGLHELREAGGSKRFSDEIDYVFDGLRPNQPVNVRRSSYFELLKKVSNDQFVSKLRVYDYIPKVCKQMHLERDFISRVTALFMLKKLVGDRRNVEHLLRCDLFPILVSVLRSDEAGRAPTTLSKYEKALISEIAEFTGSGSLLSESTTSGVGLDVLIELISVPEFCTDENLVKNFMQAPYLEPSVLSIVINAATSVESLADRSKYADAEMLLSTLEKSSARDALSNSTKTLRVLEVITLGDISEEPMWMELPKALGILLTLSGLAMSFADLSIPALDAIGAILRVFVNVTAAESAISYQLLGAQSTVSWVTARALAKLQESAGRGYLDASMVDTLQLCIAVHTNVLQLHPSKCSLFRRHESAGDCIGIGNCSKSCACLTRTKTFDSLLAFCKESLFAACGDLSPTESSSSPDAEVDTTPRVLVAYVAIFVGSMHEKGLMSADDVKRVFDERDRRSFAVLLREFLALFESTRRPRVGGISPESRVDMTDRVAQITELFERM